jgi:hypothetical protein
MAKTQMEEGRVANADAFQPPAIEDADIAWACGVMGLPATAFAGTDGNDPRIVVLKSMETLDIEACPGSGKTTLLVTKLAILANRWAQRRQGICVLSHTNAARNEIEVKLSTCSAGSALLRYPHFVGTIHSFVNEFLAVPWLRSQGYPIKVIDNEIALNVRWSKVAIGTKAYLRKKNREKYCLTYDRADFGGGEKSLLGEHTDTYKALVSICAETSKSGYFCYDEMFVWAAQLLDSYPHIVNDIRLRFPLVFIDEVQDNSELQSAFLNRVFFSNQNPTIRQRFGDSNQAIFQHARQNGATTDPFPGIAKMDLPHSFRFGQSIADAANPLGVAPQGLIGRGPALEVAVAARDRRNALFLFDDQTIHSVLAEYAKYLLDAFSADELARGLYTAVAAVHASDKSDKVPRLLGHYAPTYDPEINRKDPSPATFIQYIFSGRREMVGRADVHPIVSKMAAAILRLAQLADADVPIARHRNSHRCVLELLSKNRDAQRSYLDLLDRVVCDGGAVSSAYWNGECKSRVAAIAGAIAGNSMKVSECAKFLEWTEQPSAEAERMSRTHDNVYRYPPEAPRVNIRLGSIHSVKGETHTSTLVLDSYFYRHHLQELKPWLLGAKIGGNNQNERMRERLRVHYVAMTRPSHLLCLAMRHDSLTDEDSENFKARRWRIVDCADTTSL